MEGGDGERENGQKKIGDGKFGAKTGKRKGSDGKIGEEVESYWSVEASGKG